MKLKEQWARDPPDNLDDLQFMHDDDDDDDDDYKWEFAAALQQSGSATLWKCFCGGRNIGEPGEKTSAQGRELTTKKL